MPEQASEKRVAIEILQARITQLTSKLQGAADRAARTKEQYDELAENIEKLRQANVPEEEIKLLVERQVQRGRENQEAFDEYNRVQARIQELQDLIDILKGAVN